MRKSIRSVFPEMTTRQLKQILAKKPIDLFLDPKTLLIMKSNSERILDLTQRYCRTMLEAGATDMMSEDPRELLLGMINVIAGLEDGFVQGIHIKTKDQDGTDAKAGKTDTPDDSGPVGSGGTPGGAD